MITCSIIMFLTATLFLVIGVAIYRGKTNLIHDYDDCFAYDLVEIVVSTKLQNRGIGTKFMNELEKRVKEKGAMLIQLQAVNDDHHNHFYGKLGYKDATNLTLKTKIL